MAAGDDFDSGMESQDSSAQETARSASPKLGTPDAIAKGGDIDDEVFPNSFFIT